MPEGDIWSETVLAGEHAGEKRLSCGDGAGEEGEQKVKPLNDTKSQTRIYRERIGRTPKMIICGAGHVSIPIIRMGKMLGFTVTVIEDRPKFADHARAAGADQVLCEPFADGLSQIRGDSGFLVHHRDERAPVRYGMSGSYPAETVCLCGNDGQPPQSGDRERPAGSERRMSGGAGRGAYPDRAEDRSGDAGGDRGVCDGGDYPGEECRIRKRRLFPELLDAVLDPDDSREKVLATIISRKGSAPRSVGTKMLIRADGTTVDTIGGGCIESEVIQKALLMMRAENEGFRLCTVDMTADAAEDEGMVCGGVVEVMLEKV